MAMERSVDQNPTGNYKLQSQFENLDANRDGLLDQSEFSQFESSAKKSWFKMVNSGRNRNKIQHNRE